MSALAPIAGKLQKYLRLLGSNQDGEVLAAARALIRTLENNGADIHILADAIVQPSGFSEAENSITPVMNAGASTPAVQPKTARCFAASTSMTNPPGTKSRANAPPIHPG